MRPRALVALLALSAAGGAMAQPAAPGPIPLDNQEPRPGVVRERERAAGIAPSQQESRSEQQTVDQLYQELMSPGPAPSTAPLPPNARAQNQAPAAPSR